MCVLTYNKISSIDLDLGFADERIGAVVGRMGFVIEGRVAVSAANNDENSGSKVVRSECAIIFFVRFSITKDNKLVFRSLMNLICIIVFNFLKYEILKNH